MRLPAPLRFPLDADPILALLLTIAVREHQTCYFYAYAKGEKQRPDPDVFGCEKHQDASEYEQRNRKDPFNAGVSDHGLEKPFPDKTILTIDFAGKNARKGNTPSKGLALRPHCPAFWQADSDSTLGYCFIPPARMA